MTVLADERRQTGGRAGGAREARSETSGTGCSSHRACGKSRATMTSSASSTHRGSNNAWSSAQSPGRNAARTMTAMQKPATDRLGLGMGHQHSSRSCGHGQAATLEVLATTWTESNWASRARRTVYGCDAASNGRRRKGSTAYGRLLRSGRADWRTRGISQRAARLSRSHSRYILTVAAAARSTCPRSTRPATPVSLEDRARLPAIR
jgi:hypothetical protein